METQMETPYQVFETGAAPVKAWISGVPIEDAARRQVENVARLPFIHGHVMRVNGV